MFKKIETRAPVSVLLFLIISILLVTPDILFHFIEPTRLTLSSITLKSILFLIPVALSLSMSKSNLFKIITLSFIGCLQIIQFAHIAYFGAQLSAFAIYMLQNELADVCNETYTVFFKYSYIIPLVFIPFYSIYHISKKYFKNAYRNNWAHLAILAVLIGICINICYSTRPRFMPNYVRLTMNNSIKAFFGFFVMKYSNYQYVEYMPYNITNLGVHEPKTIVVIIGESVNYEYMSLFGYQAKTTPLLEELAKQDSFYFTKGISASSNTLTSTKYICNNIYEPNNMKMVSSDTLSLFKLAKENGFKTFYISAQSDHMLASVGGCECIDVIVTRENYPVKFRRYTDTFLFEILKEQQFTDKNFIVIHQQCMHSPYEKTFPKEYKDRTALYDVKDTDLLNKYKAAMCFNDSLISGFFNKFNQSKSKFYIVWMSDHGELFGKNGYWGHGHQFCPEVAQIPIIIQSNDKDFLKTVKSIFMPTHYEMSKLIVQQLGYEVKNPNEQKNVFYINGVDFCGKGGYIKLVKDPEKKTVEYFNIE